MAKKRKNLWKYLINQWPITMLSIGSLLSITFTAEKLVFVNETRNEMSIGTIQNSQQLNISQGADSGSNISLIILILSCVVFLATVFFLYKTFSRHDQ
jgi:hypothetical protein